MRALFQERCRNRIHITISVRRLREEFRNLNEHEVDGNDEVDDRSWCLQSPECTNHKARKKSFQNV